MPIMDGFQATAQIRRFEEQKNLPRSKIIACSGHTEPLYIEKAWRYEFDEVISKPLKVDITCEILKESVIINLE